jgi:predicted transcriptional regulator
MPKVTFSLDDETVQLLRRVAERSRKAQSLVVREAVAQYAAREEKLTDQ